MAIRPLLSVVLIPSVPMKEDDTVDGGIAQDDVGQLLLLCHHRAERNILGRLGDALDDAGVLHREEAFGDNNIEEDREHQGAQRHQQRDALVAQDHAQRAPVESDHAVEDVLGDAIEARLLILGIMAQDARAHHRREGERDDRRNHDRDRERDSEFAEETSHDIAHEEQRDQHRDQRNGERDDGEADLTRAGQRCLHRRHAFFQIARDVLDHHDGVVDHESGGDGERHEGEIVEAVAQRCTSPQTCRRGRAARPRWE